MLLSPSVVLRFFFFIATFCALGRAVPCTVVVGGDPNEPTPAFSWKDFDDRWRRSIAAVFVGHDPQNAGKRQAMSAAYILAIREQDSRIDGFRRLGLKVGTKEAPTLSLPRLPIVVDHFRSVLRGWMEAGSLKRDERLFPGVVVRRSDGLLHALPYGIEVPDGQYVDVSNNPGLFTRMVSLGIVPISPGVRALHDLNHLRGVASHPRYMAGIRALATAYLQGAGIPKRDRYIRYFHAYEAMALFPAEKRSELQTLLTEGEREDRAGIYERLRRRPLSEVVQHAWRLYRYANAHLLFLGGAGELGVPYNNPELLDSLPRLLVQLRREISRIDMKGEVLEIKAHALRTVLSRVEVALWHASYVNVDEYFEHLLQPQIPKESVLARWFDAERCPAIQGPALFSLSLAGQLTAEHETNFSEHYSVAHPTVEEQVPNELR